MEAKKEPVTAAETETKEPEKTFTQSQVDAIISERLARQSERYADYEDLKKKAAAWDKAEEENKSELQKATEKAAQLEAELAKMQKRDEVRKIREKVADEKGVPIKALSGETEEECQAQADIILNFANSKAGYPDVPDGGEAKHDHGKRNTRDQFAEITDKALSR